MATISLLTKDNRERGSLNQPGFVKDFAINQALSAVAQEMRTILEQSCLSRISIDGVETVTIRAVEPEHRRMIATAPLTARELEVLQLVVDGFNNSMIAGRLHITIGTVKSHMRNILSKLYVSDRTQAAILGLRSGLAY